MANLALKIPTIGPWAETPPFKLMVLSPISMIQTLRVHQMVAI